MKTIITDYENMLMETKSKNTVLSYKSDLTKFLESTGIKTKRDISRLKDSNISEYIENLKNSGMAYASISRVVATLRNFLGYCYEKKFLKKKLELTANLPPAKRKLPETLSVEEIVDILEAPDTTTVKGKRDKALLELMYATGAKVSEIVSLKLTDVSLKNEIVVFNTNDRHRFVPMGKACINSMLVYIKDGRSAINGAEKNDNLFLNFYGEALSRQGCWKIIKAYIEKAGIRQNVTAQTLRHSFAMHLLSNGADLSTVSEMMGYSDDASVKIYLEVMNNKIKDVYRKAHPRA